MLIRVTGDEWWRPGWRLLRSKLCWLLDHKWELITGAQADGSDDESCLACTKWKSRL